MILRPILPLAAAVLLAGCVKPPVAGPAGPNLNVGIASVCKPSEPKLAAGATAQATLQMNNDGGWCAIRVADAGQPFLLGLLPGRPDHGRVLIRTAGEQTFLDYVPKTGYAGPDSFTVTLRPHKLGEADSTVHVTVTVLPKSV